MKALIDRLEALAKSCLAYDAIGRPIASPYAEAADMAHAERDRIVNELKRLQKERAKWHTDFTNGEHNGLERAIRVVKGESS